MIQELQTKLRENINEIAAVTGWRAITDAYNRLNGKSYGPGRFKNYITKDAKLKTLSLVYEAAQSIQPELEPAD